MALQKMLFQARDDTRSGIASDTGFRAVARCARRANAGGVRVSRLPYKYTATAGRGIVCMPPMQDDHAAVSTAAATRDAAGSVEPRGSAQAVVSRVCFR